MASLLDELQLLLGKGVPADELQDRQAVVGRALEDAPQQRRRHGGAAHRRAVRRSPARLYDKLNASIESTTAAQLAAALTKHIKVDQLVKVRAGDIKN